MTGFQRPAYLMTNDNIRKIIEMFARGRHRILTVAASGDQAIFHTIAGASNIDTFDVTDNARIVQNLKTTIIKHVPYSEYRDWLGKIGRKEIPTETLNAAGITAAEFSTLFFCSNRINDNTIPNAAEYAQMRTVIGAPFKFIHSDIIDLHAKLTMPYDMINISNIFDYAPFNARVQSAIVANLAPFLNVGGIILYAPQNQRIKFKDGGVMTDKKTGIQIRHEMIDKFVTFQRTR